MKICFWALAALPLAIVLIGIGCGDSQPRQATAPEVPRAFQEGNLKVVEFDGCEYVYSRFNLSSFAHKGNCKYCAERNQQVKLVREPIFRVENEPVRHTTQCYWPDDDAPQTFAPDLQQPGDHRSEVSR